MPQQEDDDFIIIKKWIDNDFQDVLFEHTRKMKERKLITPGYTKESVTTTVLKPSNVVKNKDQMYLVRTKSKSPARRSWMFT